MPRAEESTICPWQAETNSTRQHWAFAMCQKGNASHVDFSSMLLQYVMHRGTCLRFKFSKCSLCVTTEQNYIIIYIHPWLNTSVLLACHLPRTWVQACQFRIVQQGAFCFLVPKGPTKWVHPSISELYLASSPDKSCFTLYHLLSQAVSKWFCI